MTVRISKIDVFVFRVPIAASVITSFGVMRNRPAVFVRLEDTDGVFGWGEIFANWPAAGAEHRARLLIEDMADLILGQPVATPQSHFERLSAATAIRAIQCAEPGPFAQVIAGVDIALHDMAARKRGVPLRQLLSKMSADTVPCYASGIHIKDAKRVIANAPDYTAFKVKVGFDLAQDAQTINEIHQGLPHDHLLCADANQGFDIVSANDFADRIQGDILGWLEEPLRADLPWSHWLALGRRIPLAAGENIAGFEGFDAALTAECLGFVQPDVAKWGGVTGCLAVAKAALRKGHSYCPHFLGGGIGLLASAEVLAAAGGPGLLEVDVNLNPLRDAFFAPSMPVTNGQWTLQSQPGLGVTTLPPELAQYETLHCEKS